MKKVFEKLRENSIFISNDKFTILLFFIIIINFLPIGITNAFTKQTPAESSTIIEIGCLLLEYLCLFIFFLVHYKEIKLDKRKVISLIIVTVVLFLAQINNYIQGFFKYKDILNIGIFFVNVFFYYIIIYDYKIKEKNVLKFYKCIILFALIAILWNIVMFWKEIIAEIGFIDPYFDYSNINNIKGFFGNRAGLSFLILLAIIANRIIREYYPSKIKDYLFNILFFFGIWSTHSKTTYLLMILLFLVFIIIDNKKWKKLIPLTITLLISTVGFVNVLGYFPKTIEKEIIKINESRYEENDDHYDNNKTIGDNVNDNKKEENNFDKQESDEKLSELVVSKNRIYNLSGRVAIWKSTLEFLKKNPLNIIIGVGKFSANRLLTVNGKQYQHFHNLLLELVMTGGLIELLYVMILYISVVRRVIKSGLSKKIKIIYFSSFIVYFINSMMETYGKFSIGYHDALCLIFFIAMPLLHANSLKD